MEEKENCQIISWSQGTMCFFNFHLRWLTFALKQFVFLIPTEEKVNCYKISGRQGTKISWTLLAVMTELKPFEFEKLSMPDSFMRTRHKIMFNFSWGANWTGKSIYRTIHWKNGKSLYSSMTFQWSFYAISVKFLCSFEDVLCSSGSLYAAFKTTGKLHVVWLKLPKVPNEKVS